jgi:hypothetical protein
MASRQQTAPPQQRRSKDDTAHPHQPGARPEPPACNTTWFMIWAPCAQESGAHLARTARLRVAAGVLRNQLPAAVAEHARAQQHRRGHLRPLRRGAWEAGRAKLGQERLGPSYFFISLVLGPIIINVVTHILRRFTVKPILFALPRTNKFGLETRISPPSKVN